MLAVGTSFVRFRGSSPFTRTSFPMLRQAVWAVHFEKAFFGHADC
jgi:hypothetical protein